MRRNRATGQAPHWALQLAVLAGVLLWFLPTLGLIVTSLRSPDQVATSGWWTAPFPTHAQATLRTADPDQTRRPQGAAFVVAGRLEVDGTLLRWGVSAKAPTAFAPGETAEMDAGETFHLAADGAYRWQGGADQLTGRGQRVFVTYKAPPTFTGATYRRLLDPHSADSILPALFATLRVSLPATLLPIFLASLAAYALAWMPFAGRGIVMGAVIALLAVPLHLALVPVLKLHLLAGFGKSYLGAWLAHTGFGLPLAIFLLHGFMAKLPRDLIDMARLDGANDAQIFLRIVLPLSAPALASFAVFQFLWTWNDLLVATVFLSDPTGPSTVLTRHIVELMGTHGGNWEVLATAAVLSMTLPLVVFFAAQRLLVRGLVAGAVK